jgi:hypothetical protein
MSATPPAPAPASRPRPDAAWLAFSAQMTAQVAPVAGRDDLTVTVAPGAGRGAPACFVPASAEIEVNADHLPVNPATADPANPADRERYPALWGRDGARVRARRPLPLARPPGHQRRLVGRRPRAGGVPDRGPPGRPPPG